MYFDAKLTENSRKGEIISVAVVNYKGDTFYAELTDSEKNKNLGETLLFNVNTNKNNISNWTIKGSIDDIKEALSEWIQDVNIDDPERFIQFVTDDGKYTFATLLELLNEDVMKNVSTNLLDINQDIATSITRINNDGIPEDEFNKNFVPTIEAANIDRIDFMSQFTDVEKFAPYVNNACISALMIKAIHQHLWNL